MHGDPGARVSLRLLLFVSSAALSACTAGHVRPGARGTPAGDEHGADISFTAPFDTVNVYTGERYVDQWEVGGAAMVHRNFVRLTSDAQGHRGWLSNGVPFAFPSWSVMIKFRVSGTNAQLYGDGLALWFVQNPDHVEGEVFGREDKWNGLGVFFDTFQNLDKAHHHKHPYVSAVLNDGEQHYEPLDDLPAHSPSRAKHVIPGRTEGSGCSFDFRFSEARDDFSVMNGTWAQLVYSDRRLKLSIRQTGSERWVECIDIEAPGLEREHFFGISAATGDLVDNHDVLSFSVHGWEGSSVQQADIEAVRAHALAHADARALDFSERGAGAHASADDYLSVIDEQAAEIQRLRSALAVLQHRFEYELSAVRRGLQHAKDLAEHGASKLNQLQHEVRAAPVWPFGAPRCAEAASAPPRWLAWLTALAVVCCPCLLRACACR